jgi:hypothetical protein
MKLNRITAALATAASAGLILTASPALASTAPHYYANDVAGTGRFGPPVTGTAQQAITALTGRYERDGATLREVARFARFRLPASGAAAAFGSYLRATVREEVLWTSPYETAYAVPHGSRPTTFGWTREPDLTRDVLVFTWGDLVMNCGGQPYIPVKPIPLPSKPASCATAKGKDVRGCAPCKPGTRLFRVPGAGAMCLCPQTVHVVVSQTRTVTVQVITTETTTTSTTTTVDYGPCSAKCKN